MNFQRPVLFLMLLLCSTVAFTQSNTGSLSLGSDSLLKNIASNQTQYKNLSARTRMVWNDGVGEQEFAATVRLKKDSLIWMSLGIMGIEGVRVLATPDSFRLINKLTNEYTVRDFVFFQNWLFFPVNLTMLQQIIVGEKISIDEKAALVNTEDSSTVLYFESDKLLEKIWVDTTHYTISKILLKDKLLKQDMTVTFEAYNYSEEKPFSYKRNIAINRDTQTAKLTIDFIKINFDGELSYPFEVSEKYKRIE